YSGDASWAGFAMVTGRWYAGPTEVVASSYLLRQTGHRVGDPLTLTGDAGTRTVTVVGSFMDGRDDYDLVADAATMAPVAATTVPDRLEVGLRAGVDPHAYASSLQDKFGPVSGTFADDRTQGENNQMFVVLDALIGTLTVLLCIVAALGVVN